MADTTALPEDLLMQSVADRAAAGDAADDSALELVDGLNLAIVSASQAPTAALLGAARRYSTQLFFHATGLGPACRDPDVFLWRLLGFLRERFGIAQSTPLDPAAMRETLPNWLARAAAMGGAAIVIEGAHDLRGDGLIADFDWLPGWLPKGVAFLVSASSGPAAEQFRDQSTAVFALRSAGTPPDARLSAGLVDTKTSARLLELLWASRAGLTVDTLQAVAGRRPGDAELAGSTLAIHDEGLALASTQVREQVARRLLADHGRRQKLHVELAEHFENNGSPGSTVLACWHWAAAGHRDRLEQALIRPELLASASQPALAFEVLRHWRALGGRDRMLQKLDAVCRAPDQSAPAVLGAAHLFRMLSGQDAPAEWHSRALAQAETAGNSSQLIAALKQLALHVDTDAARARAFLNRALEILEAQPDDAGSGRANLHHHLACLAEAEDDQAEAARQYRRGIELVEAASGTDSPHLIAWLTNLAASHKAAGDLSSANQMSRRALKLCREHLGSRHPTTAACCDQLAGIAYMNGQYDNAEPLFREVLEISESAFGPRHPATAAALGNLGSVLDARQKFEEAETAHRRSLSILMTVHGQTHEDTAVCMHNLAVTLESVGKLADAEQFYRRALETWGEAAGEDSPAFATTLLHLAGVLRERGEWGQAEALYRSDIELWRQLVGPDHPHTLGALTELARLYLDGGKPDMAEPLLLHLKEKTEQHQGKQANAYLEVVALLALVYKALDVPEEGRLLIEDALAAGRGTLNMLSAPVQKLRKILGDADAEQAQNTSHDA